MHIEKLMWWGGDYKNLGSPTKYTAEQVDAINSVPGLSFKQYGDDPVEGYIVYPSHQSVESSLETLCEEYNRAYRDEHDPYLLATKLQRGLVSIHPFNDYNGRLSRLLMNWSLRGEGLPPAFLENPDLDLTTSEENWLSQLQKGSADYARIERAKEEAKKVGFDVPADVFGLELPRTFYRYAYRHYEKAPMQRRLGIALDHYKIKTFLENFNSEHLKFLEEAYATTIVESSKPFIAYGSWETRDHREIGVGQGGLIPESYIECQETYDLVDPRKLGFIRERYFVNDGVDSACKVYRGGVCEPDLALPPILRFFIQPLGATSSYEVNLASGVSMTSISRIDRAKNAETLRNYNHMLGETYLARNPVRKHPVGISLKAKYKGYGGGVLREFVRSISGFRLQDTMKRHSKDGTSPFVSVSFSGGTAENFIYSDFGEGPYGGFVVETRLPKTGKLFNIGRLEEPDSFADLPMIKTYNPKLLGGKDELDTFWNYSEQEVLIPGSLDPAGIEKVFYRPRAKAVDAEGNADRTKDVIASRFSLPEDPDGFYVRVITGGINTVYRYAGGTEFQKIDGII